MRDDGAWSSEREAIHDFAERSSGPVWPKWVDFPRHPSRFSGSRPDIPPR
jgi:hypothetical protein